MGKALGGAHVHTGGTALQLTLAETDVCGSLLGLFSLRKGLIN